MPSSRPARLVPPLWLLVILALLVAGVGWLQLTDGAGDIGLNNVYSYMAIAVGAVLYGLWFLFGSGQDVKVRLGAVFSLIAIAAAIRLTVRFEGWTGSMVPVVHYAWEQPEDRLLGAALEGNPTSGVGNDSRLEAGVDLVTRTPQDFPGFLGPRRNAIVQGVNLNPDWGAAPPEILWRTSIGSGWSGFAIVNGVAVTQEEGNGQQHVVARAALTGRELWRYSYVGSFDHVLGGPGPRATPTIDDGFVFAQGPQGLLVCLDGRDGSLVWNKDLRALYGATDSIEAQTVQYGRSGSPLVFGAAVIIPAGGDPAGKHPGVVAYDKRTGELLWEGPPRAISHASPTLATLCGTEQLLVVNEDTVSAHDLGDGTLLWEHDWPGSTAGDSNNSQPMAFAENRVLLSKGYGQGALLLEISKEEAGDWKADVLWAERRSLRTKLTNAVTHNGYAYGLSDGMLECISLVDGKRVWKEGRYGHGQLLLVDDLLLLMSEEGELLLIAADPNDEGAVLARLPVLEGKTWNTIALSGGLVLVRNAQEAAAVRLPVLGN